MNINYLSDDEIHEIEVAIYNDDNKALLKAIPKSVMDESEKIIQANFKELTVQGIEFKQIRDTPYIITQDGVLYHIKSKKQKSIAFYPNDFGAQIGKHVYVKFSDLFKEFGWRFSKEKILKHYKENNLRMFVHMNYKEHFKKTMLFI